MTGQVNDLLTSTSICSQIELNFICFSNGQKYDPIDLNDTGFQMGQVKLSSLFVDDLIINFLQNLI
jgi:hypothetical protein